MRFLKWLFQPAYLLLIIVVVALYVNREAVFPPELAESIETEALVAKIEAMSEGLSESAGQLLDSQQPADEEAVETEAAEASPADEAVVAGERAEQGSASEVVAAEDVVEQGQVIEEVVADSTAEESSAAEAAVEAAAEQSPVVDDPITEVAEVEAEPVDAAPSLQDEVQTEEVADTVAESGPAVVEPVAEEEHAEAQGPVASAAEQQQEPGDTAAGVSPLAVWQQARGAVWQGELDSAVSHYRELIAIQPDNYDAYGEMGNVLLAQSKAEEAAAAYATAARLIYNSGNREIAYRVADIVLQLDQRQAEGLRQAFAQ